MKNLFQLLCYPIAAVLLLCLGACHQPGDAHAAFYFWRTSFALDAPQRALLKDVAANRLYLRFFDVDWNEQQQQVLPHAIIDSRESLRGLQILPVVFLTNRTFEHVKADRADSLAWKVNRLLDIVAAKQQVNYASIQVDCDWTVSTRPAYFAFLRALKKYSRKELEATIRLHQVKYRDRTGIPPADKGVLMFYNMGTLSPNLNGRNSIYNAADAEKYVSYLAQYPLPLDVALPVFSWSLQIRGDKIIKLYGRISKAQLSDTRNFTPSAVAGAYTARRSFYVNGIYVKAHDVFKLEQITASDLGEAAQQAARYLKPLKNRNIIYYEISSVNLTTVAAQDIQEVTAHF